MCHSGFIADTRRVRRLLWWGLGLVLVVGGLAIALSTRAGPTDFGWFAYTPLNDDPTWYMGWSDGAGLIVSRWQLAGCAVAAIGMMVMAAGIGFHVGRRRANPRERH